MEKISRFTVNFLFGFLGLLIGFGAAYRVLYLGEYLDNTLVVIVSMLYFGILSAIIFFRLSNKFPIDAFSFIFIVIFSTITYLIASILNRNYPVFIAIALAYALYKLSKNAFKNICFMLFATMFGYVITVIFGLLAAFFSNILITIGMFLFKLGVLGIIASIIPFAVLIFFGVGFYIYSWYLISNFEN